METVTVVGTGTYIDGDSIKGWYRETDRWRQ